MISNSTVIELSQKLQTTEQNIQREYIQNLFLSYFYRHPQSDKILFKGGTALRIINKSPRFSEDLDFSSTGATVHILEDIAVHTLKEIEMEGIEAEIGESKQTSGGYLAIIDFSLNSHKISIQLEVSQRKGEYKGEFVTIVNDLTPPYNLMALCQDQLVMEKIQALMSRQKARDYYDLYFILRANLLPVHEKNYLKEILPLLDKTEVKFEQELKMFLPKSHWPIIHNFKQTLGREIGRAVGKR